MAKRQRAYYLPAEYLAACREDECGMQIINRALSILNVPTGFNEHGFAAMCALIAITMLSARWNNRDTASGSEIPRRLRRGYSFFKNEKFEADEAQEKI